MGTVSLLAKYCSTFIEPEALLVNERVLPNLTARYNSWNQLTLNHLITFLRELNCLLWHLFVLQQLYITLI